MDASNLTPAAPEPPTNPFRYYPLYARTNCINEAN